MSASCDNLLTELTVHVAETTGLAFLGMMKPTRPVDSDVALVAVQPRCAFHTASGADPAEFEETVENRAVITNVVPALLLGVLFHIIRRDL